MTINAIAAGSTAQVIQTAAAQSAATQSNSVQSAAAATAKAATSKAKDDTAEFIDKAEKLILNPKSSTSDIMKFIKTEASNGKLNQEKQLALQELFQTRHEASNLLSNIFRVLSDATMNVIRNIH